MLDWVQRPLTLDQAEARLNALPEALQPLASPLRELCSEGAWLEEPSGAFLTGRQPEVGRLAYAVCLFPALHRTLLERYQQLHQRGLPKDLLTVLEAVNGLSFFKLHIFGAAPSMAADPPRLSRSERAPIDLSGERLSFAEFEDLTSDVVPFAARNTGDTGQVRYFMDRDGSILARSLGGAPTRRPTWPDFRAWLDDEALRAAHSPPQNKAH